jgi:WD40 repeat protein
MLILRGHKGKVHALAFSHDGRTLASVAGRSSVIWLWDLADGAVRGELRGHGYRVVSLAVSSTPEADLASVDSVGHVRVWDTGRRQSRGLETRREEWQATHDWPVRVAFSTDGRKLAGAGVSGGVAVWDLTRRPYSPSRTIRCHGPFCLAFAPGGGSLAVGSRQRTVEFFSLAGKAERFTLTHGGRVHHLAFSPDGRTLASASPDGLVKVWDAATGQKRTTLKGQGKILHAVCYAPDGRSLATAAGDGIVRFWDVDSGKMRRAFDWGVGAVHSVAFAADGQRAAAGGEGEIVVWDVDDWGA